MTTFQRSCRRLLIILTVLVWIVALVLLISVQMYCFNPDSTTIHKNSGEIDQHIENVKTIQSEKDVKYLTLSCYPGGRLGNQMWIFFSGWSIAKTLGRKFYYNCKRPEMDDIEFMEWMFPKLGGEFEIIKPEKEVRRVLVWQYHEYRNPLKYQNISSKYLHVNVNYAQNARYIINFVDEIRQLMQFGDNVTDRAEAVIQQLKKTKKNLDNLLCAHIRQTDFKKAGWARTYEENLLAIRHVASMKEPRTLFIMGDDQMFMKRLVGDLVSRDDVLEDSFFTTYDREIDLYLAKRLCKTFVITTERTTFGFWLAFIMNNDNEVYYLKEYRKQVPRFDDKFPLPWHAIKVEGGNSTLLN